MLSRVSFAQLETSAVTSSRSLENGCADPGNNSKKDHGAKIQDMDVLLSSSPNPRGLIAAGSLSAGGAVDMRKFSNVPLLISLVQDPESDAGFRKIH